MVRVDAEVYGAILAVKHRLERERGRRVSMSDALRDRLEAEAEQADHEREWREEHGEDPGDEGPGP